ncbi:metallo-beta-lactamase domain-containing protein [Rhizodiscina lignyota]|uniref:Metallo-beta-lactamase domain-containing protein n=1 Tax=Rhizodiscina lignyota TaxID=1504668 RepID=A0A9P4M477_9PEZI|nr:metallo-beta-lactamase domain-containing protein [Rhizodiscina lignyota]
MAVSLPTLPEIERLSPRVVRILGGNPSKFTLQGTNTYLIGQGPKRVLIDTGHGKPVWIETLQRALAKENATVDRAIITHWHPDHVGGIADLLKISPETQIFKNEPWEGQEDIQDGQKFVTDGATLRAFHTPGHTTDHMALILEEEDAMFTGDNVLGHGTAVFEDLAIYIDSLKRMSKQVSGRAYPAHGAVIDDATNKILEYIQHRQERETQILEILGREKEAEAHETPDWTSLDVVKFIYTELGTDMYPAAERGVLLVLDKLIKEGKVTHNKEANTWHLNAQSAL